MGTFARCISTVEQIDAKNALHYRVVQEPMLGTQLLIEVNEQTRYDAIHGDDFESGDVSGWSKSTP